MNKVDIFMPLYIGDYLKDTRRLTTEEHGAYLLLMMDYWQNGSLPDDDNVLARIAGMNPDAWSIACASVKAFFKKTPDGKLAHARIDRELASAVEKKSKSVERATKAAKKRWDNHIVVTKSNATSNATSNASGVNQAMLTTCPSPSPSIDNIYIPKWDEFLQTFNSITGKKCRVICEKTKRQLKARLKEGYTIDDIYIAIENCVNNQYHKENPHHLTPEFITRADKLQTYSQPTNVSKKQFIQNGKTFFDEALCDGLTREQHKAKYGTLNGE